MKRQSPGTRRSGLWMEVLALTAVTMLPATGCAQGRGSVASANERMEAVAKATAASEARRPAAPLASPPASVAAARPVPQDTRDTVVPSTAPEARLVSEELPMPAAPSAVVQPPLYAPSRGPAGQPSRLVSSQPMGRVLHANQATFEQQVLRSDVPVLVDFYADWCGPCKRLAPTLDELAAESPGARVVKVNIEDSPELAARYGVRSIPALMVFKGGQVSAQQTGAASKARLKSMLE